jgi:hypothetical protein
MHRTSCKTIRAGFKAVDCITITPVSQPMGQKILKRMWVLLPKNWLKTITPVLQPLGKKRMWVFSPENLIPMAHSFV